MMYTLYYSCILSNWNKFFIPPRTTKFWVGGVGGVGVGGGCVGGVGWWGWRVYISFILPGRLSVRPSRIPCPLCNSYRSGWILSISGTNYHLHKRVCCTWWPLTLIYSTNTAKMWHILPYLLYRTYSSGWILSIFGTNKTSIRGCVACNDLWPWPIS